MITKNLTLNRHSTRIIFNFILDKCKLENTNVIKIEQTRIAKETLYSRQTVSTELKYLQDEGYITYKRSLLEMEFYATTTTEITLTDKSIAILNADALETENKPIKTEAIQPQAETEKPMRTQRKLSAETKAKISASMKAYWAKIPYEAE